MTPATPTQAQVDYRAVLSGWSDYAAQERLARRREADRADAEIDGPTERFLVEMERAA